MIVKTLSHQVHTTGAFSALKKFLARKKYGRHFIICDENSMSHCLAVLISSVPALAKAEVIEIESGEENKSVEVCAGIWQSLAEDKAGRDTLIINLGGGVISDLGGFCASVFKRGIDFIHIPTTLLAMADASVGGKTGVDLQHIKNIVGSFAEAKAVFIEKAFLATLPERHFYNGLAEVLKIALVADKTFFNYLEKEQGSADIQKMIDRAVKLKSSIVKDDPFDHGKRKILNFGHTIGHALEGVALLKGADLLHGEAVVAGMIVECHLSFQKKWLSKTELERVVSLLLGFYGDRLPDLELMELAAFLENDKKNERGNLRFALINGIGKGNYDVRVSAAMLNKSVLFYNNLERAAN